MRTVTTFPKHRIMAYTDIEIAYIFKIFEFVHTDVIRFDTTSKQITAA